MVTVAKSFEAPIKCEYTKIIAITFTFAVSLKCLVDYCILLPFLQRERTIVIFSVVYFQKNRGLLLKEKIAKS